MPPRRPRLLATAAKRQLNSFIPSGIVGNNIASAPQLLTIPLPLITPKPISTYEVRPTPPSVTTSTHEVWPVAFDVDPFAIQSTSIRKQSDYPASSGGSSDIWKCLLTIDPATSIEVAVKAIRIADMHNGKATQQAIKRLRREVAVWIKLRHPHVLTLHGTVSGFGPLPALVSTWMDNGALHDYLERTPGLTMEQKLRLLKQVVDGLRYLHEHGIVHGDLTSTNVVIDRDDNVFLADFGLSLALAECYESDYNSYPDSANRWSAPELMGLPEPASIKDLDARDDDVDFPKPNWHSDIYSLGCIMLEVFSGKIPFWWLGKFQYIFTAQLEHAEPYRDDFSVSVEPQHLEFMRRCWSLRPEARPSTGDAASFVEDELVRLLSLPSLPKSFRAAELHISAIDQGDGDRNNDTNPASPPSPHSVPIQSDDDRGNDTHSTPPPAHSAPVQGDGDRGNYTNPMPPPIYHSAPIQGDGDRDNDTNPTSPPSAHPVPIPGDGYWDSEANPTPPSHSAPIHGDGFWSNDTSTAPPPSFCTDAGRWLLG
ncbi:kinase-like domain-containing protein [Suillus ampliporus]|nr:kinase-like domain-containing protein [Suillus ampliporus]